MFFFKRINGAQIFAEKVMKLVFQYCLQFYIKKSNFRWP